MSTYKRLLALVLVLLFAFPATAFAQENAADFYRDKVSGDLGYMDDVYRFDLNTEETETTEEILDNPKAVFAVLSLGLMETMEDGTFSQDLSVPYNEFSNIIYKLSIGDLEASISNYDLYQDRTSTVGEAAEYLLKVLGYDEILGADDSFMQKARTLGIVRGTASEEKLLSRGEFAEMIYAALDTEVLNFINYSTDGENRMTYGGTLLNERLGVFEIRGLLTAVPGVNIYSSKVPKNGEVEIDRVRYDSNTNDYLDLLGCYVFGYAQNKEESAPCILGLTLDTRDQSLLIPLSDITEIRNDILYYETEEGEKKVSVAEVRNALYNGNVKENFVFSTDLMEHDGELLLGTSTRNGEYDIAVIIARNNYRVRFISKTDQKVFFSENLKLNGNEFLEIKEDKNNFVRIVKNGRAVGFEEIKVGDVLSVVQNESGTYTHITISQKMLIGEITGVEDDFIYINGTEYMVSKTYRDEAENPASAARAFDIGDAGKFYLSAEGVVSAFEGENAVTIGLLGKYSFEGSIDEQLILRVLTTKSEWVNFPVAAKVEVDGQARMTKEQAFNYLESHPEAKCQPIRYRLNDKNEVMFLDTAVQLREELADTENITLSNNWSGYFVYTNQYVIFDDYVSYYLWEAPVFFIPDDTTEEDDFVAGRSNLIPNKTNVALKMYNVDEVGRAKIIVYDGSVSTGGGSFSNKAFAVEKVRRVRGEDDEIIIKLEGYENYHISPGVGSWNKVSYTVDKVWLEENPRVDFKSGDVFLHQLNGKGELCNRQLLVRNNSFVGNSTWYNGDSYTWGYGTVTSLDFKGPYKNVR